MPAPAPRAPEPSSPAPADPRAVAEAAVRRAEAALKQDEVEIALAATQEACAALPDDPDVRALRAWAEFCAAADKPKAGGVARASLARLLGKAARPQVVRLYLGRVERMLGNDREALQQFQAILLAEPRHADAAAEVRAIVARRRR